MSNTSATGGYLVPTLPTYPGGLTLTQYIQQVIVGMTGFAGTLVRPKWQKAPPKVLPNPEDKWCSFGLTTVNPDANAYVKTADNGESSTLQRHVELVLSVSFYGDDCVAYANLFRDGFQLAQNREALRAANMGFKEASESLYVPELHGQAWFPRCDITVVLRAQVDRTYAVLSMESASGTIEALKDNNQIEDVPWNVEEQ
jgi:hypothetical protein